MQTNSNKEEWVTLGQALYALFAIIVVSSVFTFFCGRWSFSEWSHNGGHLWTFGNFSHKSEDWGYFGEYFGGTAGTILALLNLWLIIRNKALLQKF